MITCKEVWNGFEINKAIEKTKTIFIEPKDSSKYQSTMDKYYKTIFKPGEKGGAILMGVCRGRISEGLDFSDNAARCVIIVGIPYPMMTEPKVLLKKDYLDKRFNEYSMNHGTLSERPMNGKDWYSQQATRTVNQAIGRVIRHA